MVDKTNKTGVNFILEMQGGGETTNTGKITSHIEQWSESITSNELLKAYFSRDAKRMLGDDNKNNL